MGKSSTLLRIAAATILVSRFKIRRNRDRLPPPASGKRLVEHINDFNISTEDLDLLDAMLARESRDVLPQPASGKRLVEHLSDFQASPEDWEGLEQAVKKARERDL